MEWIVLVVLGVGLGLPLLGGWLYLMRTRDPDSEEWTERMDHPTLVHGTEDHWDVQRGHVELRPGSDVTPEVNGRRSMDAERSLRDEIENVKDEGN